MKTTPEQLAELKARAIADRREIFTAYTVLDLIADLEELQAKQIEADTDNLKLIETVKYLRGIPERAGLVQGATETVERFVLGYVMSLEAKLAAAEKDAARLNRLIELCGYVEDGSSTVVKLFQDDATYDWIIKAGDKQWWHGSSAKAAIDAAIAAQGPQGESRLNLKPND